MTDTITARDISSENLEVVRDGATQGLLPTVGVWRDWKAQPLRNPHKNEVFIGWDTKVLEGPNNKLQVTIEIPPNSDSEVRVRVWTLDKNGNAVPGPMGNYCRDCAIAVGPAWRVSIENKEKQINDSSLFTVTWNILA